MCNENNKRHHKNQNKAVTHRIRSRYFEVEKKWDKDEEK